MSLGWQFPFYFDLYVYFVRCRSVNIDSEKKVLQKFRDRFSAQQYTERNLIHAKRGRGNVWSMGYYGLTTESDLIEQAVNAVRLEAEACDYFMGEKNSLIFFKYLIFFPSIHTGTHLMHSISGGTGSGLGSRLTEILRDEYSSKYLVNTVVAPFGAGDSPLQNFNAVMCLWKLQENSSAILLQRNDYILNR